MEKKRGNRIYGKILIIIIIIIKVFIKNYCANRRATINMNNMNKMNKEKEKVLITIEKTSINKN